MSRRRRDTVEHVQNDIDAALAALTTDDLRALVREVLLELDEPTHGRVADALVKRAARSASGWVPAAVDDAEVADVVAFAQAATRVGAARPEDMDERLRRGSAAFLRRDYAAAHRILSALLRPIANGEIDLGERETVDEVLGVDLHECAAQYVVAAYMISAADQRTEAVRSAIAETRGVALLWWPIREMERAAVEPLPVFDGFLRAWQAMAAKEADGDRRNHWGTDADRWLREVIERREGAAGLAKLARSTGRTDDLRAWCRNLLEAGDWRSALAAFEEAAELVADNDHARGDFLDGAALAAQELGAKDFSTRLECAWRAAPSMVRLRRWLASAEGPTALTERAADALTACSKDAYRQRAFLHVLQCDFAAAASLLATAPGLGWSRSEHPGHLLFPMFRALLACDPALPPVTEWPTDRDDLYGTSPGGLATERDGPRLAAPDVGRILAQAGIDSISDAEARCAVLTAMRKTAERRLAGVTEAKRRGHYGHAAELVAACLACDPSPETISWAASLRAEYRRFPALCAELDRRRHMQRR